MSQPSYPEQVAESGSGAATLAARSCCEAISTHVEFEMNATDLLNFAKDLANRYANSPSGVFHLQIARKGEAPRPGAPAPIRKGDPVTIFVHPFPQH